MTGQAYLTIVAVVRVLGYYIYIIYIYINNTYVYKRINLRTLILSDLDINMHFLAEGGEVVCSNFFQKHGIGEGF